MNRPRLSLLTRTLMVLVALSVAVGPGAATLSWGADPTFAAKPQSELSKKKARDAEKKAAAKRASNLGLLPGAAALAAQAPDPGGVPHYFGPYGNWAYSPLPMGPVTSITLTSGGAGYNAPLVTIEDVYAAGAGATPPSATVVAGVITAITAGLGGSYTAPIVTIVDDPLTCAPAVPATPCGTGASATASIATTPPGGPLGGGHPKFIDKVAGVGPPTDPTGLLVTPNRLGAGSATTDPQYISVASADSLLGNAYYVIGLVEFYEKMHSYLPPTRLRGYVQLESLNKTGKIALTYLDGTPIYYPGTTTQIKALDYPHYLGPTIVANSNQPVRIKFYNLLPAGATASMGRRSGDLYIPSDETVMGAGMGPAGPGVANDTYTQNRAAVHLHGNNTVWISDGTPHQWITPANDQTPYPNGVSVFNVPDMENPGKPDPACLPGNPLCNPVGSGSLTLFYTNALSARLQFYHDHAMGITRLNVYSGEAAGYVVTDQVDQDMINGTNVSGVNLTSPLKVLPDIGIPLVIQDRTFVDATTIFAQDPTWNWGTGPRDTMTGKIMAGNTGDLWYPHVYMSAQNPWDLAGANAFGRWHYGPWFINQTPTCVNGLPAGCIDVGPVANPYYQPVCDGLPDPVNATCTAPWEPPLMPGTPNPSMPGEAFVDTPMVNGTVYPYMEVEPRAYRFRILNAGNDRFLNLQLYVAADKTTPTTAGASGPTTVLCDASYTGPVGNCTEVKMISIPVGTPNQLTDTPSGIPDPATAGPPWIQIGTEGGFLPAPVVVPQQPIGWNLNPTTFNFGNVNQHSLLLGTAERADVVVDFTGLDGKTLILYNDAPAAFPAGVSVYDYYTGNADQTDVGGAPSTQPGYGPNTRTIMQIRVGKTIGTATPDVNLANLQKVFAKGPDATKRGVFEVSQDPIIVPQAAYNSAYNSTLPATATAQYAQLADSAKTFKPINKAGQPSPTAVTLPFQMKAMHDEMGGVYDTQFGRMSGMLGLTLPQGSGILAAYGFASPPTDLIMPSADVDTAPVGSLADGTQIWRIFHNGVDTHPIHVHLFTAQLLNRVGQDGIMLPPDANELGWKDTFRVNPLEVTYIAMKPILPTQAQVPFEVPDSIRLIDPTLPEGATLFEPAPAGWFDPAGRAIPQILNHTVNFGWEYVWHCHILAHEEMDMMHSLVAAVGPRAPTTFSAAWDGKNNPSVFLNWNDRSAKEVGYRIERATNSSFTSGLTTINVPANTVSYQDKTVAINNLYWYRVSALGATVGDTFVYAGSAGFPKMTANSVSLLATPNPVAVGAPPATLTPPTNIAATPQAGPSVNVTWLDNANNETGFVVERCNSTVAGAACTGPWAQIAVAPAKKNTGNTSYADATVAYGGSYLYQVAATNAAFTTVPVTLAIAVTVPALPAAPTNPKVAVVKANGNNYTATLTWAAAANPTNFTIQRATNLSFTTGLNTSTVAGNLTQATQTITKNTTYYYRIKANNSIGGSSAWANVLPFPIRTGP